MTITTHDLQTAHLVVQWGHEPKPDAAKVSEHRKRRTQSAKAAKAIQAPATGPKPGTLDGVSLGTTTGAKNPEATGPLPVEWKKPDVRPVPVHRPSVPKPAPKAVVIKPVEVEGTLTGTSGIGAKPANKHAALPCGPPPVEWVDPTKK